MYRSIFTEIQRQTRCLRKYFLSHRYQHVSSPTDLVVERAIRSIKMDKFETNLIRNFCIIAHVDHGLFSSK